LEERDKGRDLAQRRAIPLQIAATLAPAPVFEEEELTELWRAAEATDTTYKRVKRAVQQGDRTLPPDLQLKVQVADCSIDAQDRLRYRSRLWVPGAKFTQWREEEKADRSALEPNRLRTKLIQKLHDSYQGGHPGREGTATLVGRDFYWPLQQQHIRRFVKNCDVCGRTKKWRQLKGGLLKPLPVPDRYFRDIQMDFITALPEAEGCQYLWIIKCRLCKWVYLIATETMEAELCAKVFLRFFVANHGWPNSIVSDRGSNWVSRFWGTLCGLMGVERKLSTAYHPQTDGGTERVNQDVEAYLRAYINDHQDDWPTFLPANQLALNSRLHSSIGMSPFMATQGFELEPVVRIAGAEAAAQGSGKDPESRARAFVKRITDAMDLCETMMSAAAQRQEDAANKRRAPAPRYQPGDKVWVDIRDFTTTRPKKKLDDQYVKCTVKSVPTPNTVEVDGLPGNIHKTFSVDKIRPAADNELVGQERDDKQPPAVMTETGEEYAVDKILACRWKKCGRGRRREALVVWLGYHPITWWPLGDFEDTVALDEFEEKYGNAWENDGPRKDYEWTERKVQGKRGQSLPKDNATTVQEPAGKTKAKQTRKKKKAGAKATETPPDPPRRSPRAQAIPLNTLISGQQGARQQCLNGTGRRVQWATELVTSFPPSPEHGACRHCARQTQREQLGSRRGRS
jgi:hypothetical protein